MRYAGIFILVGVLAGMVLMLAECDNPVSPQRATFFKVTVVDSTTQHRGVGGLVVAAWNHLAGVPFPPSPVGGSSKPAEAQFATQISFTIPAQSIVHVTMTNLRNELVDSVNLGPLPAGAHSLVWTEPALRRVASGVYKCRLVAHDQQVDTMYYRDSTLMALWRPGPLDHPLGMTDADGIFATTDTLLFPNLLNFGQLTYVNGFCEMVGPFSYKDTVRIAVTDTANHVWMVVDSVVRKGRENSFRITWKPQPLYMTSPAARSTQQAGTGQAVRLSPQKWGLNAPCPNPFN